MKGKTTLLGLVLMCLAILGSGTLAYYSSDYHVHNVITSGAVNIEIVERQETDEGLVPYPTDPVGIMPGTTLSKVVTIKNNDAEAFVRAQYSVTITDADGNVMNLSQEEVDAIISVNVDGNYWSQKDPVDGWWYYNEAVVDDTEPFFTEVAFSGPNMTNEYQNCTIEIDVNAQAVQVANNEASALEAAVWPEE